MRIFYSFLGSLILVMAVSVVKVNACHMAAADIYMEYDGAGVDNMQSCAALYKQGNISLIK